MAKETRKKAKPEEVAMAVEPKVQPAQEHILILTVDRDNDIGKKIGVSGPIVGYENNLKVATDLLLKDPEESDANAIFAVLKKYSELKKDYVVEVATITGHSKENLFFADKSIALQLKQVLEDFPASAFVLITDGAEDEQVIPIVQNFGPIISKEVVIVRQSQAIESTYYTIKKAIKDPAFSRIIFGIPAIILLLFFFFKAYAFQIIALVLGVVFLVKGFHLESKIAKLVNSVLSKFSITKISFPFYVASVFFLIYAGITGVNLFLANDSFVLWQRIIYVLRAILLYLVFCIVSYIVGNIIDLFYSRALYKLGRAIFGIISTFVFLGLLDLAMQFVLGEASMRMLITVIFISFIFLFVLYKITSVFDITKDITELLVGLPVVSKYGVWIGEVIAVDKTKQTISFKNRSGKVITVLSKKHFFIQNGQVII
ncbi:MAG TPA: DUF373 family protein [Candidatus Diapherotrites archaeon]|nr:DUF373 family protein [Candidatus Diapherotrites archaeon]